MKIFIEKNPLFYPEVRYTWELICRYIGVPFMEVNEQQAAELSVGGSGCSVCVSHSFFRGIGEKQFSQEKRLNENGVVHNDDGSLDSTSTIFYLVNCIQEYESTYTDEIGRFDFEASAQCRLGITLENKVGKLIDALCEQFPVLKFVNRSRKSRIFLSHDIDTVHGSKGEDGKWALRNGRLDVLLKLIADMVIQKPHWLNMKKIMDVESAMGFKSVFFWLMNKGRINQREVNADYDFHSRQIQKQVQLVEANGCVNGLHKSISAETITEEMKRSGFHSSINRNHYLKFILPDHFNQCEAAGLQFDASLGFASHHGFRNSFAMPFVPYNFTQRKPYSFMEIPLHIMDGTFHQYLQLPVNEVASSCIQLLERNNTNAVISILWHNVFFSEYKYGGYFKQYKKILEYLYESDWEQILPSQMEEEKYWC
ncbi:MAG: hypothetical protein SH856_07030 [Flavobacteriales bacterium]|nr:hypothetical protein [Flavobacteriales bacterium]